MSVQAGIFNFDGSPADRSLLNRLDSEMALWGPDGYGEHATSGPAMIHRLFHVTNEDKQETQPVIGPRGFVMTWDGRLDNRVDLLRELGWEVAVPKTDAALALAAYEYWGTRCWDKLIGDWAISVWDSRERKLFLARDFIGARSIYYLSQKNRLVWCTNLGALVQAMTHSGGVHFNLCDEYVAAYLVLHPDPRVTPYREIRAVPPGGYIEVSGSKIREHEYWQLRPKEIRYHSDADYEDRFRELFGQAVRRRLRTFAPVLADLSGGLDSSSIVCMAHDVLSRGEAHATMDTISRYDEEEPSGDERPYFTKIEQHIGKRGTHIDSSRYRNPVPTGRRAFIARPGYLDGAYWVWSDLAELTARNGNRVHLAGIGGDELLGGVQEPAPQLAENLWNLRFGEFWNLLQEWSLARKKPLVQLLGRAFAELLPPVIKPTFSPETRKLIQPWIKPSFYRRHRLSNFAVGTGAGLRRYIPGPTPHAAMRTSMAAFLADRRHPNPFGCVDMSYPYLDRDLMEFLLAIPDEQLLRPNRRRSLMRRSLGGVVPEEVLFRKTKALGQRVPALMIRNERHKTLAASGAAQYVLRERFEQALKDFAAGKILGSVPIFKALSLLQWAQVSADGTLSIDAYHHGLPPQSPWKEMTA